MSGGGKSDDEEKGPQNNSEKVTTAAKKKIEEEKAKTRENVKKANKAFKSSIQYDHWENEKMKPKDPNLRHKYWGKGNKGPLAGILHGFKRFSGAGRRGDDSDKAMLDSLKNTSDPNGKNGITDHQTTSEI